MAKVDQRSSEVVLSFLIHIVINQKRSTPITLDGDLEYTVSQIFEKLYQLLVKAKNEATSESKLIVYRLREVMDSSTDDLVKSRADAMLLGRRASDRQAATDLPQSRPAMLQRKHPRRFHLSTGSLR